MRQLLKFALRSFLRAPRFSTPAVLAPALGIGATSATFSVIRGVWETNARRPGQRNVVAAASLQAWRERNKSFEYLGMVGPGRLTFTLGGQPEEVSGLFASADIFPALGVSPVIGRSYTPAEDLRQRSRHRAQSRILADASRSASSATSRFDRSKVRLARPSTFRTRSFQSA